MTEEEFETEFKKRLRALRKAAGLTQRDVAERIGIELDAYKKIETRKRSMPSIYLLPRLAGAFDVSVYFLVLGRNPSAAELKRTRLRVVH